MHIVYWAHSYRDEDADINKHFGVLIERAEKMIINLDPPSPSVNESKLDQNLLNSTAGGLPGQPPPGAPPPGAPK